MAPGVSLYSVPAGVPLPLMPVVINLPASPSEETQAPAQAIEDIPFANVNDTIDTEIDTMMKALDAWTVEMSKANEYRYVG